jgi:adenine-specific DNA-methyltransferase
LYENIDIAETLSKLTSKWIKRINDGEVEFEKDLDYRLIKPLIWWE